MVVFAGSLIGMCLTFVMGAEVKGAHRWINFGGLSLQPSEFVKPAIVTCAADDGEFQLPFREPSRTSTAGPVILASHVDEGGSVERALPIASPPAFAAPLLLMRNVEVPDGPRQ